ncbi:hypothetical protein ACFVUY_27320 [Kitasatospora sp. NPDC058063]|uniref:hypothetical protein n=1 Tax=unclassified Kitasatospora TaxID=2633591 RepID=UPI0036DF1BA3
MPGRPAGPVGSADPADPAGSDVQASAGSNSPASSASRSSVRRTLPLPVTGNRAVGTARTRAGVSHSRSNSAARTPAAVRAAADPVPSVAPVSSVA